MKARGVFLQHVQQPNWDRLPPPCVLYQVHKNITNMVKKRYSCLDSLFWHWADQPREKFRLSKRFSGFYHTKTTKMLSWPFGGKTAQGLHEKAKCGVTAKTTQQTLLIEAIRQSRYACVFAVPAAPPLPRRARCASPQPDRTSKIRARTRPSAFFFRLLNPWVFLRKTHTNNLRSPLAITAV